MSSSTTVHQYGFQPDPTHVVIAAIGITLVILAAFMYGVHWGTTHREPGREHPLLDVAPTYTDDEPTPFVPPVPRRAPITFPRTRNCAQITRAAIQKGARR